MSSEEESLLWRTRNITLRRAILRRRLRGLIFSWCQRQARGTAQNLSFLRGELAEPSRINFTLTHPWWHRPQRFNRVSHGLTAVGRKAVELYANSAEFLFLLWSQVLPCFHAPQHLLLPLRRHVVEPLESLFESLLALRRKMTELRIIFERAALLLQRHIAMLA